MLGAVGQTVKSKRERERERERESLYLFTKVFLNANILMFDVAFIVTIHSIRASSDDLEKSVLTIGVPNCVLMSTS